MIIAHLIVNLCLGIGPSFGPPLSMHKVLIMEGEGSLNLKGLNTCSIQCLRFLCIHYVACFLLDVQNMQKCFFFYYIEIQMMF